MKIPVIINNRDLLTWTRAMVDKIKTYDDVGEIIIVDNASTYPPLLEWYATNPCTVLYYDNLGHNAAWTSGLVKSLEYKFYVVTDSDLGIDDTPADTLTYLLDKLRELKINKVGLGLNRELVLEHHPYYGHISTYEVNRYKNSRFVSNVYLDVEIDTTFALYSANTHIGGAGSTWMPYVAKHYPWYYTKEDVLNDAEFKYYLDRASQVSTCKRFLL